MKIFNNIAEELDYFFNKNEVTAKIVEEKGAKGILAYGKSYQVAYALTEAATWPGILPQWFAKMQCVKGRFGNHAFLRLPNDRIMEWARVSSNERNANQAYPFPMTGWQIERLWFLHQKWSVQNLTWGKANDPLKLGFRHYRLFTNDCFTYIEKLLTAILPLEQIKKHTLSRTKRHVHNLGQILFSDN